MAKRTTICFEPQAWKAFVDDFTREEIQCLKEACCEACKGDFYFWDSDCRYTCEGFRDEVQESFNNK